MEKQNHFQSAFVLLLVAAMTWVFLCVIWPFTQALLFGAILAAFCQPVFRRLTKFFWGSNAVAASVVLFFLIIFLLGPVSTVTGVVVSQAIEVSNNAGPWVKKTFGDPNNFDVHNWLVGQLPWARQFIPDKETILGHVAEAVKVSGGLVMSGVKRITTGTAGVFINLFVALFATYYFLIHGPGVLEKILHYTPLSKPHAHLLLSRFLSITRATVKGTLLIGLVQGTLAGLAFYFAGLEGAVLWGALMIVLSVIPGGGTLIWIPAVIYLFSSGHRLEAVCVAAWCIGVVSTIDNFMRPALVGKDAQLPSLMILIGTLGGLYIYGPLGFILGPIICGLFISSWDVYGAVFKDKLPARAVSLAEVGENAPPVDLKGNKSVPVGV